MPKSNFTLAFKKEIISKVYFLVFRSDIDLEYKPGQFISLEIAPKTHRAYSVCHVGKTVPSFIDLENDLQELSQGEYICFMISTKPGGTASEFFDNVKEGIELPAIGPSGKFGLKETDLPKVFVATGTGLAPFVPMIRGLLSEDPNSHIDLFFGSWTAKEDFAKKFFPRFNDSSSYPNFRIFSVPEDAQGNTSETIIEGRVTTAIPQVYDRLGDKEFYMCGHPAMVTAMEEVLKKAGVADNQIIMEKFGK
jgi:ferredoxin-NADP reductase